MLRAPHALVQTLVDAAADRRAKTRHGPAVGGKKELSPVHPHAMDALGEASVVSNTL